MTGEMHDGRGPELIREIRDEIERYGGTGRVAWRGAMNMRISAKVKWVAACIVAAAVVCGWGVPSAVKVVAQEGRAPGEKRFECMGIGGGGQMYGVGISPHDKNLMQLSCDMGNAYISGDGGETWYMLDSMKMGSTVPCRPAYHPTDPNVVYQINRGSFRISKDRGRTWEILCDNFPPPQRAGRDRLDGSGIYAINTDPADANLIFVSLQSGLYRSADGGKSFAKCGQVEGSSVWTYIMPAVGNNKRLCFAGMTQGLYVSADTGQTWEKKGEGLPEGMYGMCAATDKEGIAHIFTCHEGGVYISHDSGKTFAQAQGLPNHLFRFISMSEKACNTVYVSNWGGDFGVFKTMDGGRTWEKVFAEYGDARKRVHWGWIGLDMGTGWGGRANCITVAPSDPDTVAYVNTGELFITRDGGKNWYEHSSKYYGPDKNHIEKGQPWGSVGLEVALPGTLAFDPFDENRWYLTYGDICFLISKDGGKSWRRSAKGIPWSNSVYRIAPDPENKGIIYAAASNAHDQLAAPKYRNGGIVLSTDAGESWKSISAGLKTDASFATDIVIDLKSPKDKRTLYCVMYDDGLFKSTDGGRTWQKKMNGIGRPGDEKRPVGNDKVCSVTLQPDGTLYALVGPNRIGYRFPHQGGGVWKSTNGAESWEDITKGLDLAWPRGFSIDPFDKDHMFISTGQAGGRETAGLWETKNGGEKWERVLDAAKLNKFAGKELGSFLISNGVIFHPAHKGWFYYTTITHGLWLTTDGGENWKPFVGIPCPQFAGNVFPDPNNPDMIYICSIGLWKGPAAGF